MKLSEDMFDAAKIPSEARAEYYKQFSGFIKSIKPAK
jgi:hypothetical protein